MTTLSSNKASHSTASAPTDQQIADHLPEFKEQHLLVIGDFILDAYVHGSAIRVCPEAPVPVVDTTAKKYFPGGAANTAINAAELGAKTDLCTVLGSDYVGSRGYQLIKKAGLGLKGVGVMKHKKTQYKTRIMAGDQMLIRMDKGDKKSPDKIMCGFIKNFLYQQISQYSGVLIADYDKGFFCPDIIDTLLELRTNHDFFLAVDSKRLPLFRILEPDLVKPNRQEAIALLKKNLDFSAIGNPDTTPDPDRAAAMNDGLLNDIGQELYARTGAKNIALTLDQDGAIWFKKNKPVCFQPAKKIDTPQVSGAGDSYIAAAMLASLSAFSIRATARIAATAASIVIAKQDTASCRLNELQAALSTRKKALMDKNVIEQLAKNTRKVRQSIVLTNGCYDLLHNGHISFLEASARLGDILAVAINIDEDVARIKGKGRPINTLDERISLLSALQFVDYVIPFGGDHYPSINDIVRSLQPVLFTKGENYRYQMMKEQALLKSLRIPLVFIPTHTDKTTGKIIQKIKSDTSYAI